MASRLIGFLEVFVGTFMLLANSAAADAGVSVKQVRIDAIEYIHEITGSSTPTLAVYQKYYSMHDEAEVGEELAACDEKFGKSLICRGGEAVLTDSCAAFISKRERKLEETQSLYLMKIRKALGPSKEGLKIDNIRVKKYGSNFSDYIITGRVNANAVVLRHAKSEMSYELGGRVSLIEINGVGIDKIVGKSKYDGFTCGKGL